jgi:Putative polyhydroxyalkanoic acid system protein (PHA_gran_rgn)
LARCGECHFATQLIANLKNQWSGDHLDFHASMLGQSTTGTVDVAEDHVRLEVQLPWLLSMLANKGKGLSEKQGKLMLEKPVKPSTTRS